MQLINLIEQQLMNLKIFYKKNEFMKNYTSFKIGGICKFLIYPKTFEQTQKIIEFLNKIKIRKFFLGNGSNLLFTDDEFLGVAICSKFLNKIEFLGDGQIYCESGVSLIELCKFAFLNSLSGLEFAYGIPGSLGGAVFMNAGAYGGEMKNVILRVISCNKKGQIEIFSNSELKFSYRKSVFSCLNNFILAAVVQCNLGNKNKIKQKMDELMQKRILKQPLNYASAGSTFKRPNRGYASKLIEACGLKSMSIGDAMVSEKHCGFIVNLKNASFNDVLNLINKVQIIVKNKTGIALEPEVKIIQ